MEQGKLGVADPIYVAQAQAIADQAQAIADGTITAPYHAAVAQLVRNVDTLKAWTPDDRS